MYARIDDARGWAQVKQGGKPCKEAKDELEKKLKDAADAKEL